MRRTTLRKIDRVRKKLVASIGALRQTGDPDALAIAMLQEFTVDALARLPRLVARYATHADAVILTQAQLRDVLAKFALDVLALQTKGHTRGFGDE